MFNVGDKVRIKAGFYEWHRKHYQSSPSCFDGDTGEVVRKRGALYTVVVNRLYESIREEFLERAE